MGDLIEVAAGIVAAVDAGDATAVRRYWHEDLVETVPIVGRLVGADAVAEYFEGMWAALPDFTLRLASAAQVEATVFVRWRMTGTFSGGAWNGIEPNGARIDLEGIDCMLFEGARLKTNFVVYDSFTFARQAGLL
jgi:predicted ester cyclase